MSRPVDIYGLLAEEEEKKRRKARSQILSSLGITEEFFEDGDITVNHATCDGVECKLCIEACPTNALYWSSGEVKVEKELCIYCCACVLSCIVDDCIQVLRKRADGWVERFGTPRDVITLCGSIASRIRRETMRKRLLAVLNSIRRIR